MANLSPRKVVRAKRILPNSQPESPLLKSVTFNDEIIETSIGGTQRVGKIKRDVLLHFDTPVTISSISSKLSNKNRSSGSTTGTPLSNGKSSALTPGGNGKENKQETQSQRSSTEIHTENTLTISSDSNNSNSNTVSIKICKEDSRPSITPQTPVKNDNSNVKGESLKVSFDITSNKKVSSSSVELIESVSQSPFRTPDNRQARRHTLESKLYATPDCYRDVNFGTPRRMLPTITDHDESTDAVEDGQDSCSIMVAVRVRPFNQRELADSNARCAVSMQGNETTVTSDNGAKHQFAYDFSFWSHDNSSSDFCDQENVYSRLAQPLLGKAFEGYNTCLFAYGQTGSGKSYSIMGHTNDVGIIPRFCADLFSRAENLTRKKQVKVNVEISFFEIYNEKIHDLLASTKEKGAKKVTLKVREHPVLGPYVEGLSTFVVNSFEDVESWITLGNKNRATAATGMNDKSSRSHSVFTIVLTQTKTEHVEGHDHDHSVNSKINLVDLAGSERQSLANTTGERLREGANINKSLLTLGKVIALLSERSQVSKKRKIFIPYRDSVLTWLLKESLGGNSKTAMIATVSPSNAHIEETLSTLRYAQQARSIVNIVRINEDPKAKIIRQLRAEIDRLRAEQGGTMNEEALAVSLAEIARLKAEMEDLSRSWQERLKQAEAKKAEELQQMESTGITFKIDNTLPNLVNLNEDPQLSEMLLYVIKEGETRVGRKIDESKHDIKLIGALIADNHCVINSKKGIVEIKPIGDAPTYVNGNLISEKTMLYHGDRVILGGDHYFRFNHPMQVQKNKSGDIRHSDVVKDYEFAKQELHKVQEARLQALLEVELEKTRQELNQQKNGYENKLKGLEKELTQAELSQKEAQSTIKNLKQQNMILEEEVNAGRNRKKYEDKSDIVAPCPSNAILEKVLAQGEAESKKIIAQLEKLRQWKTESKSLTKKLRGAAQDQPGLLGSPGTRRDLYKVELLLREANKINHDLKTNLVFTRDDHTTEDGSGSVTTLIRVVNAHHRMYTLWSVPKFEEKLVQMRDLYQNEGEKPADDEVFTDPDDVWEKDLSLSSPAVNLNRDADVLKQSVLCRTPLSGLRRVGSFNMYSPRSCQDVDISMVRACKNLLSSIGDQLTARSFEETVVDKVLSTCYRIKESLISVIGTDKKTSSSTMDTGWSRPMLQLVTDVYLLASHTTLWPSICGDLGSSLLLDLVDRSTEQVKTIGLLATSLLQGCEGKLTSLVSESGHKLTTALLSFCVTSGELAMATNSQVIQLDQQAMDSEQLKISSEINQQFLSGCNSFVNLALEGGLGSLTKCETRCSAWSDSDKISSCNMSQRVKHVLSCVRALVEKTLLVQQQIAMDEGLTSGTRPPQYYSANYKRLQGIVSSVSSVVDSSTLLVELAESLVHVKVQNGKRLEKVVDIIRQSCHNLLAVSSLTYTIPPAFMSSISQPLKESSLTSTLSTSSSTTSQSSVSSDPSQSDLSSTASQNVDNSTNISDLTDVTLLSESQLGQLDSAAQEVSMAMALFTEYLNKTWSQEAATPHSKRSQSLEKMVVTPALSTAHMSKLNSKRILKLAESQK
ncbi:kinesin-like protein KIF14 [Physella acuta]|uniref:kinesin-like protein KIF14 n=1 Tax=Physella acuta TaxID=109671 RepID=UPI0027DB7BA4|nr:kinesin-like protein KIF14 [Physella acuta]